MLAKEDQQSPAQKTTTWTNLEGGLAGGARGVARLLAAQLARLRLGVVGALRALARLEAVRQADGAGALLQGEGQRAECYDKSYNTHTIRSAEERAVLYNVHRGRRRNCGEAASIYDIHIEGGGG